jgi:UDP-N-acetyl-D-mannosaminuronate dehydrogenase
MHICIPFREEEEFAEAVTSYVRRFEPALVIINSTVLPGTTRALAAATGGSIVYSPVRGKHVKMVAELRHYTKFVAGVTSAAAADAMRHFAAVGIKTAAMARPETLELAKLAETTYFGAQIAFAQELDRYAQRVSADYDEAISFFNEVEFLPRTRYFPGFIGGHCVVPNIQLLQRIARSPLLSAILESNRLRRRELEQKNNDALEQAASDARIR